MKTKIALDSGWELKQIDPAPQIDPAEIASDSTDWLIIKKMPAQVQDILLDHGKIPEEFLVGFCENVNWMCDYDWVYRTSFTRGAEHRSQKARLIFKGIDTVADIYLNGQLICRHDNFFLSSTAEISEYIQDNNDLVIHFHRIIDVLKSKRMKPAWNGAVPEQKLVRKPIHDFDPHNEWGAEYQGAIPYFSAIGVYNDIIVEYYDEAEFTEVQINADADDYLNGLIRIKVKGRVCRDIAAIRVTLRDGCDTVLEKEFTPYVSGGEVSLNEEIRFDGPKLWYPIGYGEPYLYSITLTLISNGNALDEITKRIGFKNVTVLTPFEFLVNKQRIRLWGGSLDPLQGWTHCFLRDRAERMFELLENAHFNLLRIWGEGIPYDDEFYDMCDERGFLVWQEFFMGYGPIPDSPEYVEEYKKEARELVLRLKHHPCLFFWCGGNETILGAQINNQPEFGYDVLFSVLPRIVNEYDPGRYYLPNSPLYGDWANDSRVGDIHTFDRIYTYPYGDYPNFVTENCVTAPPALHSLRRFVKGDLFPEGYNSMVKNDTELIMPRNWIERSSVNSLGQRKSGPYWEFYDADNIEDFIYRFGAAAGQELRKCAEQVRRGSKNPASPSVRSKGYVTCKLLDTWPKIYCSTIDFFLEGYIPYYTMLRAFAPVMLSFQKEDCIRLWIVNDSPKCFKGRVTVGTYNLLTETYHRKERLNVEIAEGASDIVFDLSKWMAIPKECVLYARLETESGEFVYHSVDYVDVERQLKFKDAKLRVTMDGNELVIVSDQFVRCVEILGECDGDDMGWLFSDNYFDLMPEEERRIRILGRHDHGQISLKGHYCSEKTVVKFVRQK